MVSFEPTEDQQLIRDTVAAFAARAGAPAARDADERGEIPAALAQQAWELGLVQSAIPEAATAAPATRARRSPARWSARSSAGATCRSRCTCWRRAWSSTRCSSWARRSRRSEILPAYAGAEFRAGTAAVMEPRFDFDADELATTATRRNGDYVLNGAKCYVPLGRRRARIRWCTRAPRTASAPSSFPPRTRPASKSSSARRTWAFKALATYEVTPGGLRVPASARLERRPRRPLLNRSRVALASLAVGVARAAFEYARDYAKERQRLRRRHRAEAGDRLHAGRDGASRSTPRACSPGRRRGSSTAARTPPARRAWPRTTPPTWCSRSPTTPCRCSAATATSATTWSSCGCATAAASPCSKAWRWCEEAADRESRTPGRTDARNPRRSR